MSGKSASGPLNTDSIRGMHRVHGVRCCLSSAGRLAIGPGAKTGSDVRSAVAEACREPARPCRSSRMHLLRSCLLRKGDGPLADEPAPRSLYGSRIPCERCVSSRHVRSWSKTSDWVKVDRSYRDKRHSSTPGDIFAIRGYCRLARNSVPMAAIARLSNT